MRIRSKGFFFTFVFLAIFSIPSFARDARGRLWFLSAPISTHPQFVLPGDRINVDLDSALYRSNRENLHFLLKRDNHEIPLANIADASDPSTHTLRFAAVIAQTVAPGLYDLIARKGNIEDVSRRAVAVIAEDPKTITILHLSDIHTGREVFGTCYAETATLPLPPLLPIIEKIRPDVVLITGDVTSTSSDEEFKKFLDALDLLDAPTLVTPGNHDHHKGTAELYLGPADYSFTLGLYLFVSTDFPMEHLDAVRAEIAEHPEAPYRVLFAHHPTPYSLEQLNRELFEPERIGLFLYGHKHRSGAMTIGATPTVALMTAAWANGSYRIVRLENGAVAGNRDMLVPNLPKVLIRHPADKSNCLK